MKVEMLHVHADFTHSDDAHDGVHVGAVSVDKASSAVDDFGDLPDVLLEQPESVGIGYHDSCRVLVHDFGDGLRRKDSLRVGFHVHGFVTAEGGAGRVCPVGRIRHNDLRARLAFALVVRVKNQHSRKLAM